MQLPQTACGGVKSLEIRQDMILSVRDHSPAYTEEGMLGLCDESLGVHSF